MQNSELFRRGVVLPLSELSRKRLHSNTLDECRDIEWIEIADETTFNEVWQSNLFKAINQGLGVSIDDYEEEIVAPEVLPRMLKIIEEYQSGHVFTPPAREFICGLTALCRKGEQVGMPLFFVF